MLRQVRPASGGPPKGSIARTASEGYSTEGYPQCEDVAISDKTFNLIPRGPFSLPASTWFLQGFAPAAMARQDGSRLRLAFCIEETWQPVVVELTQAGEAVRGSFDGDAPAAAVASNISRILSLDVDDTGEIRQHLRQTS